MALDLGNINLETIVDGYRLFRRQYPASDQETIVAEIYLSVGAKVRDSDGNILTGPMGQEHWEERYPKTIQVRQDHLRQYLWELAQAGTYHFSPIPHDAPAPEGVDPVAWQLYVTDHNSVGEWYSLAAWMIQTGKAKV